MEGKVFIKSLRLWNFLSFSGEFEEIELQPLNVIIGPNSSGKSNFLEAIGILKSTVMGLYEGINKSGGIGDLIWKGAADQNNFGIETVVKHDWYPNNYLFYKIVVGAIGQKPGIEEEVITLESKKNYKSFLENSDYYYKNGEAWLLGKDKRGWRKLDSNEISTARSVFEQFKDSKRYPELYFLSENFKKMIIYSDWNLGRNAPIRMPHKSGQESDHLYEDGTNLANVLSELKLDRATKSRMMKIMEIFNPYFEDFEVKSEQQTLNVYIQERNLEKAVPLYRASDGTIKLLCLLAILCDPDPPPLICIEDPEFGFHPDFLPELARLMIEASKETQLIVTTHSDILISQFNDIPEAVIVCEKKMTGTAFKRLNKKNLKEWLDEYSLGQLWLKGEIGGNLW